MTPTRYDYQVLENSIRFQITSRDRDSNTIFFVTFVAWFSFCIALCAVAQFTSQPTLVQKLRDTPLTLFAIGWFIMFGLTLLFILINAWVEVLWRLTGTEVVEVGVHGIELRHRTVLFGASRSFRASEIQCIFVARRPQGEEYGDGLYGLKERRLWRFMRGALGFRYGKNIYGRPNFVRFARNLNHEEAQEVLELICQRFPQFKCPEKSAS